MAIKVFEIFKAGKQVTMSGQEINFTEGDLTSTAKTYPFTGAKAPLFLGHQPDDSPSFGTVQSLAVRNSALVATAEVSDQLLQLVKDGAYKKISASFYVPGTPENSAPNAWTLRHVAFLGSHPPAVKGLKPLNFMEFANSSWVDFAQPAMHLLPRHFSIYTFHRTAVELQAINPGLSYEDALRFVQTEDPFLDHT